MSKDICPFCQQEMICGGTICHYNPDCPIHDNPVPTEVLDLLERTRKALDVALCSLQDIAESNGDFITGASTPLDEHEYADMMLKEIKRQMKIKTALEQKD